ncbi:MAG: GNAT family N-acetyltransferase [Atribacteria sp.]|nr:GNAT family N-acetyltransferase [Candidatus Atribacteria bacterium]MBU3958433.1 GNAT family N-acetyltransferase [Candidatus Omnitrophota bacterium]MBU4473633.1 GNAT family N-acetyltransferase [Candidatus Omnitrophota bacterium]
MKYKRITARGEIYKGIELWNRIYPSFSIIPRLVEQNIFKSFTGVNIVAYGSFKNDQIIAFIVAKYLTLPISGNVDLNQGWISLLVVDKERTDVNSTTEELTKRVEADLKMKGVEKIRFGGDPQNFLSGLPIELEEDYLLLLEGLGYKKKSKEYDLYLDISNFKSSPKIKQLQEGLEKNLQARPVTKEEEEILLDFLQKTFPGRWYYEANNIRRIPGGIEDYWLLWYQNNPAGFLRTNTSESAYMGSNVNWGSQWGECYCGLGPIGIAADFRGKGWGIYLMIRVIQAFQQQGYCHMIIDWTTLVDYYAKLGFKPWIEYFTLYKNL